MASATVGGECDDCDAAGDQRDWVMDRLGPLDGAFLAFDTPNGPMHVAAVLVLDRPEGKRSLFSSTTRFAQVRRMVAERVHLVPRLRQRAVHVPLGIQHPAWADDPAFDLDCHLSRASLPRPGGSRELDDLVADVMSRPLDAERPLWELVVVEGLAGDRSALVCKMHHSILDGVAGAALLGAFFDRTPRAHVTSTETEPWSPPPLPSGAALAKQALRDLARQPEAALQTVRHSVDAMVDLADHNNRLTERGIASPPPPFGGPRTSLNGRISSRRRFASVTLSMEDAKLVRRAFGATANDVVLTAVGGGLRRLLHRRGEHPQGSLIAIVPVSRRPRRGRDPNGRPKSGEGEGHVPLGNQVSAMLVTLCTDVADPVERLVGVSAGVRVARAQERLHGGRLLQDIARLAVPAVATPAVGIARGLGFFDHLPPIGNVVVSSVPGPPTTLWCAGSRIATLYPVGPVADGVGLNVTVMQYRGDVHIGLLGCRRLAPDVQDLAILVDDCWAELVIAALDALGEVS